MTKKENRTALPGLVRLVTIRDVSDILNVCLKTVRNLAINKDIRAHKVGVQWRFDPEDIEAYINSCANREKRKK